MEQGDIVMIIDGVLQEGTCFIGANPGHGKTLVALALAKAICAGEPLFGISEYTVKQPRNVVYLIPESGDRAFRRRGESFRLPTDDRFIARTISSGGPLALSDPSLMEAVRQKKPVVILDTASRFLQANDENSAAQNRMLVNDIIALRAAGAVSVIILHHAKKSQSEKREAMTLDNMLRGTSDFGAMCDQAYGIDKYLLPKWENHPVDSIRENAVNEWIGDLSELAPTTQRGIVKTLQTIIGRRFDKKLVHFPSELTAKRQHPCHTPEQMQQIVAFAREPYNVLFAIAAETGMRSGEIYGLHVEDVDTERLLIHVRRSVWRGKPQSPKSKKAYRSIDIQPGLEQMILKHLNGRKTGYVFQTRLGTPFKHPRVLRRVLYPLLENLGIPKSGMHAFRHGRVSYLVECNTPIETIRDWIGHGSDEMVRLYTHLRPEYRKRVLSTIPSLIRDSRTENVVEFHPVHPESEEIFAEQVV